ncbi:MAG: histidinol-phosphate transaminase [Caldilineaceae bacterium SB0661_bin_32]|uniref:Histidinol-phosphate aminotransferase n=1 Tax=Caldilineaceae bacterium SB0661_bin_32 TaxID=2605255 RepID=A0A6B1D1Z8_9CHLR|nr:histidinol-phosphate transaminase [Caldilineaceae bacterium SB0661_bin_32]
MEATTFQSLLNPHLADLEEYTPIQPFEVLSQRLGIPAHDIVKLDANENPYGAHPAVAEALAEYAYYHIYPDPQQTELRQALAAHLENEQRLSGNAKESGESANSAAPAVPVEQILPGHGTDEILDYLCRLFLGPGDAIINTPPTFGMYSFDAKLVGAEVLEVWRDDGYHVDVNAIFDLVSSAAQKREPVLPKLLFLTSPNNPTGNWLPDKDLLRLLELPVIVVLDEAYVEFAVETSRTPWVLEHDNLVIIRTFSKSAGIAGLRLGYGIFPGWMMPLLWKFKQPYNVNVAATVAGLASLRHADEMQTIVDKIRVERDRLLRALEDVPYLSPFPSGANFVLCRVDNFKVEGSGDAAALKIALERQGILVRYYQKPGLDNCIRISVGRPEQTDRLLAELHRLA